ncbi:TMEM175 family protein [Paraburkholderia sp. ZP32-5]|uniref:TMEM175 family protein n=1 Tax=Paraburkholderia sp. ZP32-5 TaxID=2883245 RepID=UPI001F3A4940|nr:TMEM175 family protein [Paraburkholderia sp. ZP32-5]
MDDSDVNLDRFSTLSDGIFAVIITIMVLALKIPTRNDAGALLDLWPDLVSYVVSYAFIAVVWLNHHHVFKHADSLTGLLAWSNFANLFWISFIPFTTAWLASSRVATVPLTAYATVFLLVELTYMVLMYESFRQRPSDDASTLRRRRMQWIRAWIMVAVFAFAALTFFLPALVRMALLGAFLILHTQADLLAKRKRAGDSASKEQGRAKRARPTGGDGR